MKQINFANKKCREIFTLSQYYEDEQVGTQLYNKLKDVKGFKKQETYQKQQQQSQQEIVLTLQEIIENSFQKIRKTPQIEQNMSNILNLSSREVGQENNQQTVNQPAPIQPIISIINQSNNNNDKSINDTLVKGKRKIIFQSQNDLRMRQHSIQQSKLSQITLNNQQFKKQDQQIQYNIAQSMNFDLIKGNLDQYLLGEESSYFNFQFINDGKIPSTNDNYYDIKIVECIWDGMPSVMVMMTDVTQKVYLQWLKDVQGYKDQMLAQITHELRTPLNGMICQLQAVDSFQTIQEYKNCIEVSLNNAFLLQSFINDILDHSQMLKGQLRINPEYFDIIQLVQEVIELLKPQSQRKNIDLRHIHSFKTDSYEIYNDKNRLKQILLNLIGNSLKFTFEGSISIHIELYKLKRMNNQISKYCKITVKDTGVGVPKEIQDQIFQPYGTFDHCKGTNTNGIGLGLSICKQLVSLIGPHDQIQVQSKENEGSSFSFDIYCQLNLQKVESITRNSIKGIGGKFYDNSQQIYDSIIYGISDEIQDDSKIRRCQDKISNFSDQKYLQSQVRQPSGSQRENFILIESQEFNELGSSLNSSQLSPCFEQDNQSKCRQDIKQSRIQSNILTEKGIDKSLVTCQPSPPITERRTLLSTSFSNVQSPRKCSFQNIESQKNLLKELLPKEKLNILVVDDNPYNILGIETLFKFLPNIKIDQAFNGRQGVQKVVENYKNEGEDKYYIIFMDVNMPIMNGNEAISQIRKQTQSFHFIIISLTAQEQENDKQQSLKAGADYFMSKPVTYSSIIQMVKEIQKGGKMGKIIY